MILIQRWKVEHKQAVLWAARIEFAKQQVSFHVIAATRARECTLLRLRANDLVVGQIAASNDRFNPQPNTDNAAHASGKCPKNKKGPFGPFVDNGTGRAYRVSAVNPSSNRSTSVA